MNFVPMKSRAKWFKSTRPHVRMSVAVDASVVYLNAIEVDDAHRGKGFGTSAMLDLIEFAGAKPITLYVDGDKNLAAWYRRLGFRRRQDGMMVRRPR
jgi:ribosomal protein S18 acetylase RimI-like enzyme